MLPSAPQKKSAGADSDLGRYAGLGLSFVVTIALFGGFGWWLDGRLGSTPWLLIVGVVLGAVLGFVMIVRSVPPAQNVPLDRIASDQHSQSSDPRPPPE